MREQTEQYNISPRTLFIPGTGKAVFSTLELMRPLCMLSTLHSILGFGELYIQHFFRAVRSNYGMLFLFSR